jgi:hypothetical protein
MKEAVVVYYRHYPTIHLEGRHENLRMTGDLAEIRTGPFQNASLEL